MSIPFNLTMKNRSAWTMEPERKFIQTTREKYQAMVASCEHNGIFNLLYLQDECNDPRLMVVFHPIIYAEEINCPNPNLTFQTSFASHKKKSHFPGSFLIYSLIYTYCDYPEQGVQHNYSRAECGNPEMLCE